MVETCLNIATLQNAEVLEAMKGHYHIRLQEKQYSKKRLPDLVYTGLISLRISKTACEDVEAVEKQQRSQ